MHTLKKEIKITKMKILFLASSQSIHSHKWINYFAENGHDVFWVSLTKDDKTTARNINFYGCATKNKFFKFALAWFHCIRLLWNENIDFVHAHSAGQYGFLSRLLFYKNTVVTLWGSDVLINREHFFLKILLRFSLAKASLITSDAKHMFTAIDEIGIKPRKTLIINFGIDVKTFKPILTNLTKGKKTNVIKIISTRNFELIYDLPTLLRAAAKITKNNPKVKVQIIGSGPQKNKLNEMIFDLGIAETTTIVRKVENKKMPALLANSDLYVSTSLSDAGIAASTAEAMAMGTVVVVSDINENNLWIENGKSGFLFKAGDHNDLADKIQIALKLSPKQKKTMNQLARKKIVSDNNYQTEMQKSELCVESLFQHTEN